MGLKVLLVEIGTNIQTKTNEVHKGANKGNPKG